MKPSERINEIANSKEIPFQIRGTENGYIMAIQKYLDEQYEQEKPCEHKLEITNEIIPAKRIITN